MQYQHSQDGWIAVDAPKHTRWADTPFLCRVWRDVAKAIFEATHDEDRAVRAANAAVISERRRSGALGGQPSAGSFTEIK